MNLGLQCALDNEVEICFPGGRVLSFPFRNTILYIWTTHERMMFPIEFWGQNVKNQVHWTSKLKYAFQAPECYPFKLESPYHTYRKPQDVIEPFLYPLIQVPVYLLTRASRVCGKQGIS
jgi:hypothetical protein